jgi:threonine dehydratase
MIEPPLPVGLADIQRAQRRIAPYIKRTPVLSSAWLNQRLGADLQFKCENLQCAGAFKARGAHNAVFALSDAAAARGVATHSSGNHAAALALAARNRGVTAHLVMPHTAPAIKLEAVRRAGGIVHFCEPTLAAREAAVAKVVEQTGASLIHPYNNLDVIAGQGTAALEFLEQCPEIDVLLAPVGGGGLMSGTAIAARRVKPGIRLVATEPEQADDAYRSWTSGRRVTDQVPQTIADGLRTTLGENAFTIFRALLDDFITVSEASIIEAMRLVWENLKIVIEPSSAVPVAALLQDHAQFSGKKIGVILSGGNVDLDRLPWQVASWQGIPVRCEMRVLA